MFASDELFESFVLYLLVNHLTLFEFRNGKISLSKVFNRQSAAQIQKSFCSMVCFTFEHFLRRFLFFCFPPFSSTLANIQEIESPEYRQRFLQKIKIISNFFFLILLAFFLLLF